MSKTQSVIVEAAQLPIKRKRGRPLKYRTAEEIAQQKEKTRARMNEINKERYRRKQEAKRAEIEARVRAEFEEEKRYLESLPPMILQYVESHKLADKRYYYTHREAILAKARAKYARLHPRADPMTNTNTALEEFVDILPMPLIVRALIEPDTSLATRTVHLASPPQY